MHHLCTTDSRHERTVRDRTWQEVKHGWGDDTCAVRGRLIAEIEAAATDRTMFGDELPEVLGIPAGSLRDGTLSTARLREALLILQALPNESLNLTGRHRGPITVLS